MWWVFYKVNEYVHGLKIDKSNDEVTWWLYFSIYMCLHDHDYVMDFLFYGDIT